MHLCLNWKISALAQLLYKASQRADDGQKTHLGVDWVSLLFVRSVESN